MSEVPDSAVAGCAVDVQKSEGEVVGALTQTPDVLEKAIGKQLAASSKLYETIEARDKATAARLEDARKEARPDGEMGGEQDDPEAVISGRTTPSVAMFIANAGHVARKAAAETDDEECGMCGKSPCICGGGQGEGGRGRH